jgi:hypothetical protein
MRRRLPISSSACPICWSAWRPPAIVPPRPPVDLGRVEEGLHDILRSLERQHASLVALADSNNRNSADTAQPVDTGIVDLVKRELVRHPLQPVETDRRTQDSLETVHSTLGHVVDRLSMIEGDLRVVRTTPAITAASPAASEVREEAPPRLMTPLQTYPQQTKPELPNPAALQAGIPESFVAAPREFHAAQPAAPSASPLPPRAISEILEPHAAAPRTAIAPELPPDHPLEPGTRPPPRVASPSERIAASENAISEIAGAQRNRSARRASLPPRAAPRRPRPPRRRPRRRDVQRRPRQRTRAATRPRRRQGGRQEPLGYLLQDPLAAGRRQRGRDRARHFQDGDDAARHRQRAASADDGTAQRAGRTGAGPRAGGEQRPARNARSTWALDDLADAGRETVEQFFRTEHAG